MVAVTVVTIGLTIWLYGIGPKGFFPQQDTGSIMGITEGAQDISFDLMVQKQNQITDIVKRDPAVASVTSAIGSGGGGSSNQGRMFITLKPRSKRQHNATQVVARLRAKTLRLPGLGCSFQAAQDTKVGGRPTKSPYTYSL